MKAVVFAGDSKVNLVEAPKPELRKGWALVRVKSAGICGSDLRMFRTPARDLGNRVGQCIGHEAAGIVEDVDSCASGLKPGDRVAIYHFYGCGVCRYCVSGNIQLCAKSVGMSAAGCGSSTEYVLAPAINCMKLPDGLSFAEGALMACCAATAYSGLRKLGGSGENTLAIFGMGPVGLSALLQAKCMGYRVIAVEMARLRLEMAQKLGADEVVEASNPHLVHRIIEQCGGLGADFAIETSGAASAREQALEALAPQGKLVLIGLGKAGVPSLEPYEMILKEKIVMGSYVIPLGLFEPLAHFLLTRPVHLERIITHRFSLDEAEKAFAMADALDAGKVIFQAR